jgi:large subunit ribosomal protein L15
MPIGPFRTQTQPVNLRDLDRFDDGADVTPDTLVEKGLLKNTKIDVKILGDGELTKKLTVTAHAFSKSAREKIEAAGGKVSFLRGDPDEKPKAKTKAKKRKPAEPAEPAAEQDEAVDVEPEGAAVEAEGEG